MHRKDSYLLPSHQNPIPRATGHSAVPLSFCPLAPDRSHPRRWWRKKARGNPHPFAAGAYRQAV